jgi:hypothetical protein
MGSMIDINDTLQIDTEQGWPTGLNLEQHLKTPYKLEDIQDRVFEFKNKPKIRVFKQPPVRNFLVQNIGGKWVYWGMCFVTEVTHDYENQTTSGKFKVVRLNTPEQMKQAFHFLDVRPELDYFA